MLNREKYAKEILDVACSGHCIAKIDGKITECSKTSCAECDFGGSFICQKKVVEWANSEYIEPQIDWSKVAVDTPILVRNSEEETWRKRYFAKYEHETVYAWSGGATSWSVLDVVKDILDWKMAKLAESEE